MQRSFLWILCIILICPAVTAQILKGRITTASGDPIPYATVYIRELRQGTTSNTKGDYEFKLPSGKYQITYQSLGYSPVFFTINITDQTITRDVILPLQYYEIPEVRINATGEDPAYRIMRKAIGMAPYYLNYISYYKAEVYLKGNLHIKKMPKILQKKINAEVRNDQGTSISSNKIKEGDVYLMESFNEVEFTAPDKYAQKVISINSTFPDQGEEVSPMDFIQASFYQPQIGELLISPLSPKAFAYYKFKYMGASLQGDHTINKIQVIPKMKSQQLFEGTIFIIEDLWCIHSVDLTTNNIAGKIMIEQVYVPVQNDIWMPVSHIFSVDFSMLGLKADAGYGGSVKYLDVKLNKSLRKPDNIAANYEVTTDTAKITVNTTVSKNQQKIEEIFEKDDLTNRDMVVLSRLMDKESKKTQPDSVRENLEIKDRVTHTIEKDANKKDSAYWAGIRPVPLSDLEMKSIIVRDSIKKELSLQTSGTDTLTGGTQKKKKKLPKAINYIATGHTWSDTTGFSLTYGGLADQKNFRFNTVDGFTFGQDFRISKKWKNGTGITIAPSLKWAFSRERLLWTINGNYSFNRMSHSQMFFRTGITSRDFSTGGSINSLLNSVTSLFMKKNYLKLYESNYLSIGYRTEITNGLNIEVSAGKENRRILENTTDFAFKKSSREYSDNFPENQYLDSLSSNPVNFACNQGHFEFVTNVTFTPRQKYRIYKESKIPGGSDWPTFTFIWKHGINDLSYLSEHYKHYDMFIAGASKNHEMGAFREFRWSVKAGGFADNRYVPYIDFFHFNTQPLLVVIDDYRDVFRLPAYYSLSTPELFGEVHIKYTTPYLLIKYLPVISKSLVRENLMFSYLGSRFHPNYTEIGYTISEIFFFAEIGIYAGFEDMKFKSFGARCMIKLN